jgi:hypothetical protein
MERARGLEELEVLELTGARGSRRELGDLEGAGRS